MSPMFAAYVACALCSARLSPKVPLEQSVGSTLPSRQYAPRGQTWQSACACWSWYVLGGHLIDCAEPVGQCDPAGHAYTLSSDPFVPVGQK